MPTYPLTIPSELKVRSHYLRKQHAVGVSESPFDYQQQVFVHDGERYLLDLTFAPVADADAAAVITFYQNIQGMEGTFSINISGYDKSVSGDTSITFRLAKGGAPGYRQSINGIWEFDSLQLAEVV